MAKKEQDFANILVTDKHIFTVVSTNKDWLYSTETQVRIKSAFENAETSEVNFEEGTVKIYVRTPKEATRTDTESCEVESTGTIDSEEDWREDD